MQDDHQAKSNAIATALLILTCILTAFSVSSTILRCFTRLSQRVLRWDDGLILAATALLIARTGLQIHSIQSYKKTSSSSSSSFAYYETIELKEEWITQLLLFPTICLLKCSCCLLLLRFDHNKPTKRITKWLVGASIAGLVITNLEPAIVYLAECSPIKAYWEPEAGTCWTNSVRKGSLYLQMVYSIFFDFIFTLIPICIVYAFQLRVRDKILIWALAGMGCVVTASAAVQISTASYHSRTPVEFYKAAIFANIELHVGMVAVNLAYGYHIYSAPRFSSRISDIVETERTTTETIMKPVESNEDGHSAYSGDEEEELGHNNDDISITAILDNNKTNKKNYTNTNTVNTDITPSKNVAGHGTLHHASSFVDRAKSLLLLLPSRSQGKIRSSSSPPPSREATSSIELNMYPENDLDETDNIPLKNNIKKVTEYFVESTRLSQVPAGPPGNGNWFISGKLPV